MFNAVHFYKFAEWRSACTEFETNFRPSIVFIVIQKHHHVRFMLWRPEGGIRKTQNIPPGIVIDNKIVYSSMFDSYSCSHRGILGTSKPTNNHAVHDDADNTPNGIYMLQYLVCRTYTRCTRSLSLPAPAHYAHLIAFHAKERITGVIYGGSLIGSDVDS
ncbi:protein argonaute-2-like [Varroa jacobsoni]|uniref:protein argonaute-2-like n=1 Tax=Varroa jacobsoni TaxID=62625 RepID=UPI000BF969A4|nr:protein argonaute-2-like [Varroa jacobsoni]